MFNVKFTDIGEGIHEGIVFSMNVTADSTIEEGETLFLVETDKVTAEIPSPVSGKVVKVNAAEGDEIHVGEIIVEIDDGQAGVRSNMEGEDVMSAEEVTMASPEVPEAVVSETVEEAGSTSVVGEIEVSSEVIPSSKEGVIAKVKETIKRKVLATPVARKLAKDLSVDIQTVEGTGPAGRVMKSDIYAVHDKQQTSVIPQPVTKAPLTSPHTVTEKRMATIAQNTEKEELITRQPMTMIRKTIAEHMVKSKFTIPHTAVMDEVDVTELVNFRNESKGLAEDEGVKLTYLSLIIKAVTIALKQHPIVNASLHEAAQEILIKHFVNMGIAVDTPQGLMVPVIKGADKLSILEIAEAIVSLSERAKTKALSLDELHGSSFTITNYGAFGSSFGVPVINYPDAAVLGIGAIIKKPVVIDDEIVIRSMLPLSMSFDHRIIDGADAGRFMATLKKLLSTPQLLLLS